MLESTYQHILTKKIEQMFPGCLVFKNDPRRLQGVPDLLILFEDKWAMLEVKMSEDSVNQPNQNYYVDRLGTMSFASFIYPENEEEVLSDLQHSFGVVREARIS
jgi:hypothetical protein